MEEILHHLGCINPVNNGINYQPQLVIAGFLPSTVPPAQAGSIRQMVFGSGVFTLIVEFYLRLDM